MALNGPRIPSKSPAAIGSGRELAGVAAERLAQMRALRACRLCAVRLLPGACRCGLPVWPLLKIRPVHATPLPASLPSRKSHCYGMSVSRVGCVL